MNILKYGIGAMATFLFSGTAFAVTCDRAEQGVYINHSLDGQFEQAHVTVKVAPKSTMEFEVNIPCGTKLTPAVLYASCNENSGRFEPVVIKERGGEQCFLGVQPSISIIGENLFIFTHIRTPGFRGTYEFQKQR